MTEIAPYVNFNFKAPNRLGRRNKSLITRHWRAINEIEENYRPYTGKMKPELITRLQSELNAPILVSRNKNGRSTGKLQLKNVWVPINLPANTRPTLKGFKYRMGKKHGITEKTFPFTALVFEESNGPERWAKRLPVGKNLEYQIMTYRFNKGSRYDHVIGPLPGIYTEIPLLVEAIKQLINNYSGSNIWAQGVRVRARN